MGMYDNPPYYLSAYGLAVKHGYTGSESEWLVSITAYGLACAQGYEGTLTQWIASLKGDTGTTCYEAAAAGGYEGTETEFNALLAAMAEYIDAGTAAIADGSVTTSKLATAAVTAAKLAGSAVETEKLNDGAVTAAKLAAAAVTKAKISDGAVSGEKIENGAVTRDKISDGEVTNGKLATAAVTADKIGANAVTGEKIALNAVSVRHSVSIGTGWSGMSGPYMQTASVEGMTAEDEFTVAAAAGSSGEAIAAIALMTFTGGTDELLVSIDEDPGLSVSVVVTQEGTDYTVLIPAAGWTATGAPYYQSVNVEGLRSDSKVSADIIPSSTFSTAEAQLEAWAEVYRIVAEDDAITVYAKERTETTVPIQLLEVRK